MRIIDEKGRIFGKINVIDFLVILFLLFLVPVFYFGYKILTKRPIIEAEERIIDLHIILINVNEDLVKKISVGDREVDESGKTIAEILYLGKVENSTLKIDLGGGNFVIEEDKTKKQIYTKMRLKCQVKEGGQLYFKEKKVDKNTPLEFKTDSYEVIGLVAPEEKRVSLRVKFSEVVPEIASIVQKGNIEKDVFERTIARIDSIISNEPALVETITADGKFITLSHPFKRDIVASLNVLCVEKGGVYYFKEYIAKMGNEIIFNTDSYSISGLIVGIEVK